MALRFGSYNLDPKRFFPLIGTPDFIILLMNRLSSQEPIRRYDFHYSDQATLIHQDFTWRIYMESSLAQWFFSHLFYFILLLVALLILLYRKSVKVVGTCSGSSLQTSSSCNWRTSCCHLCKSLGTFPKSFSRYGRTKSSVKK